jgi:NTE family protein
MNRIAYIMLILVLFCNVETYSQQTQNNNQRPKVGLCLSGGGARGMAHIGVLKVIDEVGLPIDYITGVSMGSIVGGMYAMGYSADSIFSIFKAQNWEILLTDQISERSVMIDEKYRYNNYLFEIGYRDKIFEFPTGLLPGQQISTMMSTICWDAYNITDFDSLTIPFLAVSADLVSCTPVTMNNGHLPDVMRSSMAIPTVFTPVIYDSLLVVDGGLVRNIAVDEVIEMGADIVIGSYTGRHLFNKEELENSITNMLSQISSFTGLFDAEQQIQKLDILIQAEYEDISPSDFSSVDLIIDRGYQAALEHKEELQALADSLNQFGEASPKRNIKSSPVLKFDEICIDGNDIYPDYQVQSILEIEPNYVVSAKTLAEKMDLLFASNYFTTVSYRITEENDKLILHIRCKEKPRTIFNGSLHYDNYLQAGVNVHAMTRNFLFNRSRFTIDMYISEYYRGRFNYLKYLGKKQRFGYFINAYSARDDITFYNTSLNQRSETFNINTSYVNTGFEYVILSNNRIEVGAEYQHLLYKPQMHNTEAFKSLKIQNVKAFIRFNHNTFDNKHFPRKGSQWEIDIYANKAILYKEKTDSSNTTYRTNGIYSFDWTLNSRSRYRKMMYLSEIFSLEMQCNFGLTSERGINPNDFNLIGGTEVKSRWGLPMAGFPMHEVAINNAAGVGFGISAKIGKRFYIGNMNYFYAINNDFLSTNYEYLYGSEISFGYNTRIGPIKLSLQHGDFLNRNIIKDFTIYFSMGYNF